MPHTNAGLAPAAPTTGRARRSISETFRSLRQAGRIGLMPFLPAGYPDLDMTVAALAALERGGASLIEIGIPFSDPIADGPVIQQAFTEALSRKLKLDDLFSAISRARDSVSVPLAAMVSYSIVFRRGVEPFCADCKRSGFDALIIPDLPPPEAQDVCGRVRNAGLDTVLLIAPTTTRERRAEIASLCSGFVYYLSLSGITGERDRLPPDVVENVRQIKGLTDKPVCVGFGISKAEHVQALQSVADGAIVGSAIVRKMRDHKAGDLGEALSRYCSELLGSR